MKTIGKYQVAGEIGRSAAGVTCRARDPFRGREYALKVLSPLAALSAAAKEQLYRDLNTAWQLSHRHIAKVHDIGELEALLYIATDLLPGSALPGFLSAEVPTLAEMERANPRGIGTDRVARDEEGSPRTLPKC